MNSTSLPLAVLLVLSAGWSGQALGARDVDALPATVPTAVLSYGSDVLQFGQLRVPEGQGPFPIAIVIHGGCWTKGYATLTNTAPIASVLAQKGVATWNIESRQVGDADGGWPGSFQDWAAAADYVRVLAKAYPLDLTRVAAIGHSSGAHAALWLAARHRLPATSEIRGADPITIGAAVAIDGWGDLPESIDIAALVCRQHAIEGLMGGTPEEVPERYAQGSPQSLLPLGARQFLVVASVLPLDDAEAYQQIAREQGDEVEILAPPNARHFEVIAPGWAPWQAVEELILERAIPRLRQNDNRPRILTSAPGFGLRTDGFGFMISPATNATVLVEATTDLARRAWLPVSTNQPSNGTVDFNDPAWAKYRGRFYRIRSP